MIIVFLVLMVKNELGYPRKQGCGRELLREVMSGQLGRLGDAFIVNLDKLQMLYCLHNLDF